MSAPGRARIDWAERDMPVLRTVRARLAAAQSLAGIRVVACMHVTAETAVLVETLLAGGAQVALCASNPLSTQDDCAAALAASGAAVHARRGVDAATYDAHIEAALALGPQVLIDDGCDLVTALHQRRPELLAGVIGGCEETTTGVARLRQLAAEGLLRIPMVAVNDTDTKHMFDNRYGTGQSTVDALFRALHVLLAGRTVVVAGFGYCGRGVAARARGMGANVVVTEIDPTKALDAAMEGYRVLPMAAAAPFGDVFVTVTGNVGVVRPEHVAVMKDGAVLANCGHFDVEVDVTGLAAMAVEVRRGVRPHADEYTLADGRRIVLLAEGRLANLSIAEGHPPAVMDLSFADQALTVEWLVTAAGPLAPGVYDVPRHLDREVAALKLAALGMAVDQPTPDQQRYLSAWPQPGQPQPGPDGQRTETG